MNISILDIIILTICGSIFFSIIYHTIKEGRANDRE